MKEFEGFRILLADDEEIAREIVANMVGDLGAECVTACDGDELLGKLNGPEGDKVDFVLTDINMPGRSGIEACSAFRASEHPRARSLPFIGISADTKLNHIVMKNMLKKMGVENVTSAMNGREALDILKRDGASAFDVLLTDLFMPEMTGEEQVAAIRADESLPPLPVYVFTADVELKDTYAEKGFSGALIKPATIEPLNDLCGKVVCASQTSKLPEREAPNLQGAPVQNL